MMTIILMLIVAVAAFNIVATLIMVVTDKRADIAILRTLGLSPASIVAVFMILGIAIGWAGTALNLLAGFTMEDDQRMMIDLGLSTILLCGTLLAAFIATNVLNREIQNRTVLTVISKPVSRPVFVLGK